MTMAPALSSALKAAQLVSPMNGGSFQPSTVTGTSLRGEVTLNTPSASLRVPLRPVMVSTAAVSSAIPAPSREPAKRPRSEGSKSVKSIF